MSPEKFIYTCGPNVLIEALATKFDRGEALLEARMGCGFGACMGCSKKTGPDKYKRVCVEGPMFTFEEVRYGTLR
jgi:dihydroorotate dehydrogenase electron transfer subunit